MSLYALPDDLSSFSDVALNGRLDEIATLAEAAANDLDRPASDNSPSGLDVAESLADAQEKIRAELAQRAEAAAAAEERRAAVLARLTPTEPEPTPEPEPEGAPVELAVEPAPVVEEPAVELAATPDPVPTPEPVPAPVTAAPVPQPEPAAALAQMNAMRTPAEMPHTSSTGRFGIMKAVGELGADGFTPGQVFDDIDGLAEYFTAKINTRDRGEWSGPDGHKIPFMSSQFGFAEDQIMSASDLERNFGVMDAAGRAYRAEQDALVASGGPCAPLMPTYEFFTCYEPQRPVEAGLPVVGAPRGGIRFLNPVPLGGEAAAAITNKTAAQSALVPPAYTPKNCTRVSCPAETSVTVGSISWCVTFDNLNFRVFPEQVRNMLERVAIEYAKAKEIRYLGRINQLANTPIDINAAQANPFGAVRSLYRDLKVAGHNFRKRNNMNTQAILDVWLPDVVEEILAVDATNDHDNGGLPSIASGPGGNLANILTQRCRMNVNYYYYDSTEVGFPLSAHEGSAAAWRPLPSRFRSYMYSPGSVTRLNAGQLDLGIVRDSTLNGTNDLQMFAEEWIEVARVGCEIAAFDHTACYSGVGPNGVAAPACP